MTIRETIGNDQKITVVKGQTVQVGTRKEGGHDQSITVANDRRITVRNDQTLKVTNDRTVSVSHDDGLYVRNDRRVTVKGKQEHKTTGNHVSLVEGKHSLVVKGDLARKVSGALGIKVDGEIVLESSSRISLKVGGSFVVIHSGGVDIVGPKINLNSGGSPGTPVPTLQPTVLKTPGVRRVVMAVTPEKKMKTLEGAAWPEVVVVIEVTMRMNLKNILSSSILQTMTGYRIQKYATLPSLRTVRRFAVKRTRTGIQKFSLEPMMQM